MSEQIVEELATLETELRAHEGYLKRNWLTPEGYKKWNARKQSLLGKILRRQQKAGILYSEKEFQAIYDKFADLGSWGVTLDKIMGYDPKMTPNHKNRLQKLHNNQYLN